MGELIEGKFGENNNEKKSEPEQASLVERKMVVRVLREIHRINSYLEENFGGIAGINLLVSNDVLATAEKEWEKRTLDDLLGAAEASTKQGWQKYPGRYFMLVEAL